MFILKTWISDYGYHFIWSELNGHHRRHPLRSSNPTRRTLDDTVMEAPDLTQTSNKEDKISAMVPVEDLMLAIVFSDSSSVSIIYDKNVFETEKKKADQKPSLAIRHSFKKFFLNSTGTQQNKTTNQPSRTDESTTENRDSEASSSGSNLQSQSTDGEESFKRPNEPEPNFLLDRSIVVDGGQIIFKIGSISKSFEIITSGVEIVESIFNPTWIPQNPYADPTNKKQAEAAKEAGIASRSDFWKNHFRNPFNLFDEIECECEMPYFFVPLNVLLTMKQKNMVARDWVTITNRKEYPSNHYLYVLFDRTLEPKYSGIL